MKQNLEKRLIEVLASLGVKAEKIVIDHPDDFSHGDYSTNIALLYSKELKTSPRQLAEKIVAELQKKTIPLVSKIEIAGPGFINFFLASEFFNKEINNIVKQGKKYGANKNRASEKIIIEYTDPNPFKEFHIGHLMNNSIGESVSRLIEATGADIKRLSYGGDVGLHVAKAMFGVLSQKSEIEIVKNKTKKEQLNFWAKSYVAGSTAYDENESAKIEIDNLNKIIFDKGDKDINVLYDWGREVSIAHFQEIFKLLDTKFDRNFWESEIVADGLNAVEIGLNKGILEKSDGAVVFRGENYGLHTRVFVNSKGVPTYEAKELGLGIKKYQLYNFNQSIVLTGNEQNDYFKVVLKAIELIKPEVSGKTIHIGCGMLRFASGKMSSRKGNVITAVSLIEEVKNLVLEKMKERNLSDDQKNKIAEIITIGALRYSILRQTSGKDIIFDFDKSISFEGDSGPYLQYTAVRAKSVLEKAKNEGLKIGWLAKFSGVKSFDEVSILEKRLYQFPEIIERCQKEYSSHYLATYLIEIASEFNSYYANHKIVEKGEKRSLYRLQLTQSVVTVLENGLHLLGIEVPERM